MTGFSIYGRLYINVYNSKGVIMPKAKAEKKGGRPTKYQAAYNEQARKLCLMGYTDKELANFFNVSESTLNLWKLNKKDFSESLKAGKEIADANVVASLYEKATGYSCIDTKFASHEGEITGEKEYTKNYPPCPISIKYWLNNRQPERFREKVEIQGDDSSKSRDELISKLIDRLPN